MSRTAKAWVSPDILERLNRGETVVVRVPPNVSELRLSTRKSSGNSLFVGIFDGLFRDFFKRR